EVVLAAQRQETAGLASGGRYFLGLWATGCAPENRIGLVHRLNCIFRQYLAGRKVGNKAILRFSQRHWRAAPSDEPVEDTMRLRRDLGTDPFAADHSDLDHIGPIVHGDFLAKWIQGRAAPSAA